MFEKILIANRGEIACRVIKTARRMGIATVAVHSDADRDAVATRMADEAVPIGPAPASESYLVIEKILAACRQTGAQAVHPGYGFLSENPRFAAALEAEGIRLIGPPASAMEAMGDKITSKKLAAEAGVSTVPGYMGLIADADEAVRIAGEIGYPVMIKASAGGGGKGMRIAWSETDTREGFQASKNEAAASFGDDRIFIEKFVTSPRHIEIQVLGDTHGTVLHLGERECSIQRRNQKVIEEAPSPFLTPETRAAMGAQAVALAKAVGYCSAGTVEFIVDGERNFYFLEMNTRLQVEHPVTELVTGIDLVEQMIRVAAGERLPFSQEDIRLDGWAMESRLYAEDPYRKFLPSTGRLTRYRPPEETAGYRPGLHPREVAGTVIRNDTGVEEGGEISRFYDPMIAKLCSWGPDRAAAIEAMRDALDGFEVEGIGHNLPFLSAVMDHPRFVSGEITTAFIAEAYPDGFSGVVPSETVARRLATFAAHMAALLERRNEMISGQLRPARRHPGDATLVATLGGRSYEVALRESRTSIHETPDSFAVSHSHDVFAEVRDEDGTRERLSYDLHWAPHRTTAHVVGTLYRESAASPDGWEEAGPLPAYRFKVDRLTEGFRIRHRGADLVIAVRRPRVAELARLMPEKVPPDTSKMLLCPMPGIVVSIAVAVGEEVQPGQPLATVEAMKMENILRAEREAVVKSIAAEPGQSLGVDAIILEFE